MRDLVSDLGAAQMIVPEVLAADNTPLVVDLAGFDSCAIALGFLVELGHERVNDCPDHYCDASDWAGTAIN
jgi:hypothetical protein